VLDAPFEAVFDADWEFLFVFGLVAVGVAD